MSKMNIDDSMVHRLPIRLKRYEVVDINNPGFGIRVNPGGKKSWFYRCRHNSKIRVTNLGDFSHNSYDMAIAHYQQRRTENLSKGPSPATVTQEVNYVVLVLKNYFYKAHKFPPFIQQGARISTIASVYRVSESAIVMLLELGCFIPSLTANRLKLSPSEETLLSYSWNNVR